MRSRSQRLQFESLETRILMAADSFAPIEADEAGAAEMGLWIAKINFNKADANSSAQDEADLCEDCTPDELSTLAEDTSMDESAAALAPAQVDASLAVNAHKDDAVELLFEQLGQENLYGFAPADLIGSLRDIAGSKGMEGSDNPLPGFQDSEGNILDDLAEAIGLSGGGPSDLGIMPEPTTPSKAESNTHGGPGRAPVDPSYNSAAWLGGAASGDGEETLVKETNRTVEEDGTVVVTTQSGTPASESGPATIVTNTTVYHPDGSQVEVTTFSRGNTFNMTVEHRDANGRVINQSSIPLNQLHGPDDVPDNGAWARWLAGLTGVKPDLSLQNPDLVNPEGPDDSGPQASVINPGDSIVVNPSGETAQAREVSQAHAEHWKDLLSDLIGGKVNPPGPGDLE